MRNLFAPRNGTHSKRYAGKNLWGKRYILRKSNRRTQVRCARHNTRSEKSIRLGDFSVYKRYIQIYDMRRLLHKYGQISLNAQAA